MTDATLLLLRLGFLALLWLFVLLVVGVLRSDLAGRRPKTKKQKAPKVAVSGAVAAAAVAAAPPPKPAKAAKAPRKVPTTAIIADAGGNRTVTLADRPISFGRTADNTVVLNDDYASGHHCRLVPGNDGWTLEDLGSTNGTYVAGRRISGSVPMRTGSRFTVGKTEVVLS